MGKEDELRQALNDVARQISQTQSNPRAWHSWLIYLLERLEDEATQSSSAYTESFNDMLRGASRWTEESGQNRRLVGRCR